MVKDDRVNCIGSIRRVNVPSLRTCETPPRYHPPRPLAAAALDDRVRRLGVQSNRTLQTAIAAVDGRSPVVRRRVVRHDLLLRGYRVRRLPLSDVAAACRRVAGRRAGTVAGQTGTARRALLRRGVVAA